MSNLSHFAVSVYQANDGKVHIKAFDQNKRRSIVMQYWLEEAISLEFPRHSWWKIVANIRQTRSREKMKSVHRLYHGLQEPSDVRWAEQACQAWCDRENEKIAVRQAKLADSIEAVQIRREAEHELTAKTISALA